MKNKVYFQFPIIILFRVQSTLVHETALLILSDFYHNIFTHLF